MEDQDTLSESKDTTVCNSQQEITKLLEKSSILSSSNGDSQTESCSEKDCSKLSEAVDQSENTSRPLDVQPILMFGSASSPQKEVKSALFEFGRRSVEPEERCGFDSADSTNDADYFTTQEAVQSAIKLIDTGIVDDSVINKTDAIKSIHRGNGNDSCTTENDKNLSSCETVSEIQLEAQHDNKEKSNEHLSENQKTSSEKGNVEEITDKHVKKALQEDKTDETKEVRSESTKSSVNPSENIDFKEKKGDVKSSDRIGERIELSAEEIDLQKVKVCNSNQGKEDVGGSKKINLNKDSFKSNIVEKILVDDKSYRNDENNPDIEMEEDNDCIVQESVQQDSGNNKSKVDSEAMDVDDIENELLLDNPIAKSIETEIMDCNSDSPVDGGSRVEIVSDSISGNTIAVTIEDVDVSVFDDSSTDTFSEQFFKSLRSRGEKLPIKHFASQEKEKTQLDEIICLNEEINQKTKSLVLEESTEIAVEEESEPDDSVHSFDKENSQISTVRNLKDIEGSSTADGKYKEDDLIELESDKDIPSPVKQAILKSTVTDINSHIVENQSLILKSSNNNTSSDQSEVPKDNTDSMDVEMSNAGFVSSKSKNESDDVSESNTDDECSQGQKNSDYFTDLVRSALANNEEFRRNISPVASKPVSNGKSGDSSNMDVREAEVISLVDDDDEIDKKKKPAAASKCVNPGCMSGENLDKPAMFVLSYFRLKRAKDQQVCEECFNMALEHRENLARLLKEGKPLYSSDFPEHKDVILLDSDEESFSEDESYLSDDTMEMIRENLDDVIAESIVKYKLDHQIRESCDFLNNKVDSLEEEAADLTRRFDQVQTTLDQFRSLIYQDFNQPIKEIEELHFTDCEIPPMPIIKSKLQNQLYNKELMARLRKNQQERDAGQRQYPGTSKTIATKKVTQMSPSLPSYDTQTQDVIALHSESRCDPPPDLPPPGPLLRPKLRVGYLAYTMKVSYFSIWVLCRVIEVIPRNTTEDEDLNEDDLFVIELLDLEGEDQYEGDCFVVELLDLENDPATETYRVRLENVKKNSVRTVTGKYLAYPQPAKVQLKVGTRVIAIFREEEDASSCKQNYYVGVIAEPPKSTNKYRYLVFFDDGYTQYCPHDNILVVCSTSKNVWEDIHPEPRDFIKNYLQQYPERPMVKMSRGQVVKVEWNGRWWIVRVLEVDASLVKVHFDADRRTEWIYRGSTRLGPMYQELAAAKERQSGSLLRSRGFGSASTHKSDMPYVEYTRGDGDEKKDEEKDNTDDQPAIPPRSVARKSTAKKPSEPIISNTTYAKPLVNHVPQGTVTQRTLKPFCKPIRFQPHQCNKDCVAWTEYSPATAKKFDPLIKPLMFGFSRLSMNFRGKTTIHYRAPCGRMIRSQQEMLCYLQVTRSALTIDLFDFDFWVNVLNQFEEAKTFGRIEDLSYGKENMPISCVNELDHSMPQYVQYMTARQPAKDVNLNLDPGFLVVCDCKDGCEDRSKCSCWQLTMQGKAYIPDGDLDPLFGYQYRRLPERIATGIYECNSRCKCSSTCQNRVAQQPLSCRLQLFKTPKKGWGIRCLHDIPRGAFLCIYAGFLLTEQEANEGGKTYGDEYLAELDYIESVENLKEGYESEAKEPSDFEDEDMGSSTIDIEYEQERPGTDSDVDVDVDDTRPTRHEDIRLRLRRRVVEDSDKDSSRKSKTDEDAISISDDEGDSVRKPQTFNANIKENEDRESKYPSVRDLYGEEENVYIMDAKTHGNIGRYLNHSCSPNVFVQNVFVDTHDLRFPWVAFFANQYISAGTELTWDYNYDVGSVPGKVMLCYCGNNNCRGRLL